MFKKVFFVFLSFLLLVGVFSSVLVGSVSAQETTPEPDSFEMFWPLVAGKTMSDSLYFLKTFKEELRGAIIFGANPKANYEVLLATKRVLEAEKLAKEGKMDMSKKTIEAALSKLNSASGNIDKAKSTGSAVDPLEMSDRLTNLVSFSKWLSGKYSDVSDLLLQVEGKASSLLAKL